MIEIANKLTIATFLLISTTQVLAQSLTTSGRVAGDAIVHAHKGSFPVSAQSCSNSPSQSFGWFWDDQKCERCASDECICSSYNTCDSCLDGYIKITDNEHPFGWCVKCPSFSETPYLNSAEFLGHESAQIRRTGDMGLTAVHSGADDIVKSCCSPFGNVGAWTDSMRRGLRATSCFNGTLSGKTYKHFGSFCWFMDGCTSYTNTGKCNTCKDGWYLDDNQICRTCRKQCMEKDTELNITVAQAFATTCTDSRATHQPCTSCSTADQCTSCKRGYYLAKSSHFNRHTSDTTWLGETLWDASWCRKCANKCHCTVQDIGGNMTFEVIDNSWWKNEANECKLCSEFVGQSLCATCNYVAATTTNVNGNFTCLTCVGSSQNGRAVTFSVSENSCLECDLGCFRCARFANTTTTCKIGSETFCMNGYRVSNNSEARVTCTRCENQDATRCRTQTDGSELITQCKSEGNSGTYETGVVGYHNRAPPNTQDFYLIQTSTTVAKCVQNKFSCKTMKAGTADGLCNDCYPGFLKVNDQCIRCGVGQTSNCLTCTLGTLDQGLQCETCAAGKALDIRDVNKKQCVLCVGQCSICTFNTVTGSTEGMCTQCVVGYHLDQNDKTRDQCKPCIVENCRSCVSSPLLCDSCIDTYRLWQSTADKSLRRSEFCEQCEFGCVTCNTERKQCTQCQTGFFLWHGVCHRNKANCALMNGFNCEVCNIGYRRVDSQCLKCFDLEGGHVHCHKECDISNTQWSSTIDNTWVNVNKTECKGPINGSKLSLAVALLALLISLIM